MSRKSLFPVIPIEEALVIAQTIWDHNGGNPMRRVTIFNALGRQPESGPSRTLVTASLGYGITEGGNKADMLKLTDAGRTIVGENNAEAKLDAVLNVVVFRAFFEKYKDATVPSQAAALDFIRLQGIPETGAASCLEVILANGRQVGLIQEISGKERIVSREHALEELAKLDPGITSKRSAKVIPERGSSPDSKDGTEKRGEREILPSSPLNNGMSISVNIQITLPETKDEDIYDKIFASLKRHFGNS